MAHPHQSHKQHHVEKRRVHHLIKGYAKGGYVGHSDEAEDRKLFKKLITEHDREAEGRKAKRRADRVMRKAGGRVKKGATHVNVIVHGGGDKSPSMPSLPSMGPMAAMPPGPQIPPVPPAPGLGGPPPLPMKAKGGPVEAPGHNRTAKPMFKRGGRCATGGPIEAPGHNRGLMPRAKGGSVKSGPAWEEGRRLGTQVQSSPAKSVDLKNLNRGKPITYAKGGPVEAPPHGRGMGPKLSGGVVSGEARLEQATRAMKRYGKPMKETNGAR